MFGKRGSEASQGNSPTAVPTAKSGTSSTTVNIPKATAAAAAAQESLSTKRRKEAIKAPAPKPKAKSSVKPMVVDHQTEEYYETKASIFNTLIDTIDLGQLAQLDVEAAREEIRDIVREIITIKGVVLSISEQETLLQDICNDVLGYGPLEPLLERDDIADIMVNGAGQVYIEVEGKVQLTNIRFRDNTQLMNICQRIVSQVGRRVDESSPICDARLEDGSRVNVIANPLSIDGPALTIRKFKKDKLTMKDLVEFQSISPEGATVLGIVGASRCNVLISGGTGSGKTTLLNCMTAFIEEDERVVTCEGCKAGNPPAQS
jgi:pilus assembly protein CpaF